VAAASAAYAQNATAANALLNTNSTGAGSTAPVNQSTNGAN
jgi:hypothetical protein